MNLPGVLVCGKRIERFTRTDREHRGRSWRVADGETETGDCY